MGAVFELPIVVLGLTALGIVTPACCRKFRRHAVVICLVASAFITPGQDPVSLVALAVPLYGLYEVSVICSRFVSSPRKPRGGARSGAREPMRRE